PSSDRSSNRAATASQTIRSYRRPMRTGSAAAIERAPEPPGIGRPRRQAREAPQRPPWDTIPGTSAGAAPSPRRHLAGPAGGGAMSIVVESLVKRYGGHPVVNQVSLEAATGELFVLLGPSGCGKSTVLKTIAGLVDADEGRVRLQGRDVTAMPPQKRGVG